MTKDKLIVVALGGNAISRPHEEGNVAQQFANTRETCRALADLVDDGNHLVITHGNGPQIGNFLLRNEAAGDVIYALPMEVAVAHVQGGMGFMIAQSLTNELSVRGYNRVVTAIVTTILVDRADPSFKAPTKPIGRPVAADEAERLAEQEDWDVKEVAPGQYRRVVPSPPPLKILEIDHLRRAVRSGDLLVACGGGGIPVYRDPVAGLSGVRAVIDKDLASSLLAAELHADMMLILTNVDRVCINHRKPDEQSVDRMTLDQAQEWLDEGQFPPGSMGPKIQGAIDFLTNASDTAAVVIGPLDRPLDAIAGKTGTHIVKA
ncbi:MAG: carbamate kinase [Phycisphaerae bacterium]|jgi:carbamate kinase